MNFELSEHQKMVEETAKNFARTEIVPRAKEIDVNGVFPSEIIKKLGQLGFMGIMVSEKYGGAGMDTVSYVLALKHISSACASTGVIMSVNNSLVCAPVEKFGTETHKMKYLPPLARGEKLGCFCLSEPEAGSDAASQKTRAVKKGDRYVLNGVKNFITNGREADIAIVFAMTDPKLKHRGISAFIVETKSKGFHIVKEEDKLGIRGSSTTQIVLEDVEVPEENRLGEEGEGFKIAMTTLDGGRIGIAAQALGIAHAAFEEALSFVNERRAFGQRIIDFQGIQWTIADMAMKLECAELLVLKAAYFKDKGKKYTKEAAMAKLFSSETAMWITTKALQLHGGYGYVKDYNVERHFRDAKITEIYEGTSEIQRIVIAREILREYGYQI